LKGRFDAMAPIKSSTSGIPNVNVKATSTASTKAGTLPAGKLPAPAVPDRFTSIARPATDFSNRDLTRNNDMLARLQAADCAPASTEHPVGHWASCVVALPGQQAVDRDE